MTPGRNRRVERDVRDEIDFHIQARIEDNLARGMNPEDARREAEERFGDIDGIRREVGDLDVARARRGARRDRLGDLGRDLRFALRSLVRRPGFTFVAVITLALGIGANAAVFSLADTLLLQPVPGVRAPDSLIVVSFGREQYPNATFFISQPDFADLRAAAAPALTGLATAYTSAAHVAVPGARTRRLDLAAVTAGYGELLGLKPALGRLPEVGADGNARVVMISDRLWTDLFSRSRQALGRVVTIDGSPFTVVGVAPPGFRGPRTPGSTDLWVPVQAHADVIPVYPDDVLARRDWTLYGEVLGRRAPGVDVASVQAHLKDVAARTATADASSSLRGLVPRVSTGIGLTAWARARIVEVLKILGTVAAFLLALACANMANLLLGRAATRRQELAVRRALGAGRGRLVRQLTTEAMLLAGLGGGAGVVLAMGFTRLFRTQRVLSWLPPLNDLRVTPSVLWFALAVAALTGLVFGVAPSILATRRIGATLQGTRRGIAGRVGSRSVLVVVQVAISLTLVVGAGLLLDTVRALRTTPLGFDPHGVIEASLDPGTQGYDPDDRLQLFRDLLDRARAIPGVTAAGLASFPVQGSMRGNMLVRPEGAASDDDRAILASSNSVTDGFLAALHLELVAGRDFLPQEVFEPQPEEGVLILSETAARHVFPDGPAVGRHVDVGHGGEPKILRVVGVVRDARVQALKEPGGALALKPLAQGWPPSWGTLYTRAPANTGTLPGELRRVMNDLDPELPLFDVQPAANRIDESLAPERLLARLTGAFAVLALLLAAVGLYGVMAAAVQERSREWGVRLALGADPGTVRSMILRQGLKTTALGVLIGVLGATQGARAIAHHLWGVSPLDPRTFAVAVGTLLAAAGLACWTPARRATRVDVMETLRSE